MGDWRQAQSGVGFQAAGLRNDSLYVVGQHVTIAGIQGLCRAVGRVILARHRDESAK
jgi:hypothetical protein